MYPAIYGKVNLRRGLASHRWVSSLAYGFCAVFLSVPTLSAADESMKSVLNIRNHQIYINPGDADQARDAWVTALWSMKPAEVALSQSKAATVDSDVSSDAKPLVVGFQDKRLTGVLDTRTMATTRIKLATVVMKYIYSSPLQPWSAGSSGLEFTTALGVDSYDQHGKAVS